MFKKLCYLTAALFTLLLLGALSVSAAPQEMSKIPESKGLICIDIYNPETVVSTTTQSDYVLSGIANPGVVVSVYYQEKSTGKYKLVTSGGKQAVQTIGSSGYFAQRVLLNEGKNNLLIRVDSSYSSTTPQQIMPLEINLLVDSFWDRFKSTSNNREQALRSSLR